MSKVSMASATQKKVIISEYAASNLDKPSVIVGFPEAGLVGTIAASYLIQTLSLPELGYVESSLEPAAIVVQKSMPKFPIRLFGKEDLAIFISDIPLTARLAYELTDEIVRWSLLHNSRVLIGITGIPSEERVSMEGKPRVLSVSTAERKDPIIEKLGGVQSFDEGVIAGGYALLLKRCLSLNQPNITLLAESHLQFPDPGAAAAIIDVLNPLLSMNVDVKQLLDESEQIRLKMRELMSRTQQSMQQMSQQAAPRVYA